MPEKTIRQQPVTMAQVKQVVFIMFDTGIDGITSYQPVDETGTPVGEVRSFTETFRGPDATRVANFLGTEILSDINAHEGTA
jgi:hypothetical protein